MWIGDISQMKDKDYYENGVVIPLSPVQQGMFFHYIHKRNKDYMEQMICDITGDLNINIFERTINKIIESRDSLRTIFMYKEAKAMQQVVLAHREIHIDFQDITGMASPQDYIDKCISEESDKNFDLSMETFRCKLFKVSENNYVFLSTYSHLILDAWAIRLLEEEFCKIYYHEYENISLDYHENYTYQSYVEWINSQDQEKAKIYWNNYLSQYSYVGNLELPDFGTVQRRKTIDVVFDAKVKRQIDEISRMYKVTINSVILAIWGVYVLNHFQKEDILLGCVVFGRMIRLRNVDKIVGLFVNSIPLYLKRNCSLKELATNLQKDTFAASEYTYLSLSDIMACGNLRPSHINTFVNFSIDSEEIINCYAKKLPFRIKNIHYIEQANYEVYLDVYLKEDSFNIMIHFDEDKYYFNEYEINSEICKIVELFSDHSQMQVGDLLNNLITNEELSIDATFNF